MNKTELQELYNELCEDINTITITHFCKLNDLKRGSVYMFIKNNPSVLHGATQKSMQKYYKIIHGKEHKELKKLLT